MCEGREHRFTVKVIITRDGEQPFETKVAVMAIGTAQAIAKADYWATENYPDASWVDLSCYHSAYQSIDCAIEHGAIK